MRQATEIQSAEADTKLAERPVLIGMSGPEHALFPVPSGGPGWQLWQMLRSRIPDLSRTEYLRAFDRYNLLHRSWDPLAARKTAMRLQSFLVGRTVVLLGEGPRRAFNIPKLLLHPQDLHDITWRQVPHPSARNGDFYSDPVQTSLVAMLLESLYQEWKERQDAYVQRPECLPSPARNDHSSV